MIWRLNRPPFFWQKKQETGVFFVKRTIDFFYMFCYTRSKCINYFNDSHQFSDKLFSCALLHGSRRDKYEFEPAVLF